MKRLAAALNLVRANLQLEQRVIDMDVIAAVLITVTKDVRINK